MKINLQNLVKVAILTALSIVLTRFLSIYITPQIRIGIGSLPLILAGMYFGPVLAILAGISADLIGIIINAGGTPHLGFTLSSILTSLLPALVCFNIFEFNPKEKVGIKVVISVALVYVIAHLLLNTLWLSQLFGTPYNILFGARVLKVLIEAFVVGIILRLLINRFGKYILS